MFVDLTKNLRNKDINFIVRFLFPANKLAHPVRRCGKPARETQSDRSRTSSPTFPDARLRETPRVTRVSSLHTFSLSPRSPLGQTYDDRDIDKPARGATRSATTCSTPSRGSSEGPIHSPPKGMGRVGRKCTTWWIDESGDMKC